MLIGGDDISNNVITLGLCFHVFFNVFLHYFVLVYASRWLAINLTAQSIGSHRRIGGGIQIAETKLQVLLPFPAPLESAPESLLHAS